jgi:hypothetical protein
MRLGILADIHEAIPELRQALAAFRDLQLETVVSLGDACDTFSPAGRAGEVVELLRAAGAVGVWGNHDVGMCFNVNEHIRRMTAPEVLDYLAGMKPHLILGGCRFSNVEPWLDAHKVEDLWYFDGPPDTPEKAARSFAAVPEQRLFVGHFHRWLVMTPTGRVEWNGESPLTLDRDTRTLVVVAPVVSGWCAVYDTREARLSPIRCAVET